MVTRAALYVRVSTEEQAKEGFSLSAQEHRLRAYAEAQGWTVANVYRDDGESARTTANRPGYCAMLQEADAWDVLVVLKLDRLHRNVKNLISMVDDFQGAGKGLASVTESLDTGTAMGRFVLTIFGSLAQLESEQTGERVVIGMAEKARTGGGSLGTPAVFGYHRINERLCINSMEAEVVREMFHLARAGMGYQAIAKILNHRDVIGKPWDRFRVRRVIRNPTYTGSILWNGIVQRQKHEAIVAEDIWEAVQERHETGVSLA